jgi:sec-independent protein translocase protein TatA
MPHLGPMELIIILLIVVLLFGAKKIPDIAKGLGKGIRDFKTAVKEGDDDETKALKKPSSDSENRPAA